MARILIIDDDVAVRGAMQVLLQLEGFDVVLAADGASGLAAVQADPPDVVIVDMFMPGMNGEDTIRALRERAPHVPIIAASGAMASPLAGSGEDPGESAGGGADLNLHKPFRPRQLIEAVRLLLQPIEHRGQRDAAKSRLR
jgi:two-component system response regulator MprA